MKSRAPKARKKRVTDDGTDESGPKSSTAGATPHPISSDPDDLSYTTRPPWMEGKVTSISADETLPSMAGDAAIKPEKREAPEDRVAAKPGAAADEALATRGQKASAENAEEKTAEAVSAEESTPAAPALAEGVLLDKEAIKAERYYAKRRSGGNAFILLFRVLAKFVPIGMVLGFSFYVYKSLFAPMPDEEFRDGAAEATTAVAPSPAAVPPSDGRPSVVYAAGKKPTASSGTSASAPVVVNAAGADPASVVQTPHGAIDVSQIGAPATATASEPGKPMSRVGRMLQQAKDAVSAHDKNVHAANALADLDHGGDLSALSVDAGPADPNLPTPAELAAAEAVLRAEAAREAEIAAVAAQQDQVVGRIKAPELDELLNGSKPRPIEIIQTVDPSKDLLAWAAQMRLTGVREGDDPRVVVNRIPARIGGIVDYDLEVYFDNIDVVRRLLIFKDKNGAYVTKPY
ncbi:hypothetical protein [Synoicihabitans lomoniglobus]|uniref:hypothetical protein n=1 Tax=Synoicihabitans lomoniglobus TaxID=2909285 RepID=UPI002ED55E3A|nr:hypothetical protein [Opitutaceae bacterium LMO-M01]